MSRSNLLRGGVEHTFVVVAHSRDSYSGGILQCAPTSFMAISSLMLRWRILRALHGGGPFSISAIRVTSISVTHKRKAMGTCEIRVRARLITLAFVGP
jgi:hypothetical protein